MTDSGIERDDATLLRQEAIGAFSHEIRTPLTSIRMVLELAIRQSGEDELVLDGELAHMLNTSVDDLQRLVDELQETSRLERGRAIVTNGPANLRESIETAAASIGHGISLVHDEIPSIEGPWDPVLLPKAIAGFAETANRAGEGMGGVAVTVKATPDSVQLVFRSGTPSESSKAILADVGFSYFRSRQYALALRGTVSFERGHRFAAITMTLPRN